jgi:alanyl-tRNA synthetase
MNSQEIRQSFLDFFQDRGHTFVPSSSLIPQDDPTLLFTNAGMNQFKQVLLGAEKRAYVRAANSQKCMRVSGKHNDLEAVGRDGRHHTFFEMLGNWSFGDYYKAEAIQWAWEFLTKTMALDPNKLLVSIYKDDAESYGIWKDKVGVPEEHIYRLGDISKGDEENFWSMGDTGPCGPCTEIHFDQGSEVAGGDERPLGENDSDRYLEVWNLVFIQYDRDSKGNLSPLPLQSVDTGMGLERLAALKAKVSSNYDTDLFEPLIRWVAQHSGKSTEVPEDKVSMQVIADHARALTFTVADGGRPGNDGRGYVLRRILRRAARHGRRLGFTEPFLYQVADLVIDMMGGHYRELLDAREHVLRVIRTEEERFNETLDRGLVLFDEASERATKKFARRKQKGGGKNGAEARPIISAEDAFKLHDTFGFPLDLTELMASEKGMQVDVEGFEAAMEKQRARARAASNFSAAKQNEAWNWLQGEPGVDRPAARFVGYTSLVTECEILGYRAVDREQWELVVDPCPFYAESGGQIGDRGFLENDQARLEVLDARSSQAGPVCLVELRSGQFETAVSSGKKFSASVDASRRRAIMRNHTATHLLHRALRDRLGSHATQAGSLVAPERLRFDFHHDGALGKEALDALENDVNAQILADRSVTKHVDVPLEEARGMGAVSMFGEKYGDKVRVVQVGDYSIEFCGGTHCDHTGEIGLMRITGESAVAAGVRRIEAITGPAALRAFESDREIVRSLGESLSARPEGVLGRVEALQDEIKSLRSELAEAHGAQAKDVAEELLSGAVVVEGVKLVASRVEIQNRESLMQMGDALREKLHGGAAVLAAEIDGKVAFLAVVTDDIISSLGLKAGDLVKRVAKIAGGSGGGRPHLAQAGGKDPAKIDEAIEAVPRIVKELISSR